MAKKRKAHHRRRRVGAAALNLNSPVVKLAAVAGAYFLAADPVNNAVDGILKKIPMFTTPAGTATDPTLVVPTVNKVGNYAASAAEGFGAYMLLMKGRSGMVKTIAGAILAAASLKRGLKAAGVITGYGVNGYQSVPVIAGYQSVPVIGTAGSRSGGGWPRQLSGYGVNGRAQSVMGNAMDRGVTTGSDLMG